MLNKNDPLIGAVQEVMKKNQTERDAVRAVNEKFGVVDRRALPHEQQANWDAAYAKVLSEGVEVLEDYDPIKRDAASKIEKGAKTIRSNRQGHIKDFGNMIAKRKREDAVTGNDTAGKASTAMNQLYGKNKSDRAAIKKVSEEALDEMSEKQKKLAKVGNEAGLGGDPTKIDAPDLKGARMGHAKHIEEAGMIPPKGSVKRMIVKAKAGIKSMSASSDKKFADKYHPAGSSNPVDRDINKGATKKAETAKKVYNRLEEEQLDERNKENKKAKDAFVKRVGNAARKSGDPKHLTNVGTGMRTSVANKIRGRELTQGKNRVDEEHLEEKAVSKAQHRFFGLVRGIQKGEAKGSAEATKAAKSMSVKSVRDYAKTKEKGLPEKKD